MEYNLLKLADVTLIRLHGRIDHKTAKELENELKPHLNDYIDCQERRFLIDLGGVDFITSAGLRVLMILSKICAKRKGEIVVAALQPTIEEVFRTSRFDLILQIFPTVKAALEKLSPAAAGLYRTA